MRRQISDGGPLGLLVGIGVALLPPRLGLRGRPQTHVLRLLHGADEGPRHHVVLLTAVFPFVDAIFRDHRLLGDLLVLFLLLLLLLLFTPFQLFQSLPI